MRPTRMQIDLSQLSENYRILKEHVTPAKVMPILKANAYGHGLVEVARHLTQAPYIGLAYLEEALKLRAAGITTPVLVLGGIVGEQIPLFLENNLTLCASSVDKLLAIEDCAASLSRRAKVHLKIDTGMERIGTHWYSAEKLLAASLRCKHVEIEGVFSHFANADDIDLRSARMQLARFEEVCDFWTRRSLPMPLRHMANSGAILQLSEANFDMVRPGILLYGAYPDSRLPRTLPVRPAMRLSTRVVYFKVVKQGNPVGYGSTWAPTQDTRVITLPIGYGDGYLRSASGKAQVLRSGKRYNVVGRICMDQLMVDIGQDSAYNGDEFVLLGGAGDTSISIEELASWAGTITHEVLTSLNDRIPRVYVSTEA